VDSDGIERGVRMQVWLIASGGATLLFILLLVGMMFQSFLATVRVGIFRVVLQSKHQFVTASMS
jgi:hypothetical protein